MTDSRSKRIQSVEFLRFVGACIIVYFHILHSNIIPFTNEDARYAQLAANAGAQGAIVEFFLLISGFFFSVLLRISSSRLLPQCWINFSGCGLCWRSTACLRSCF